MAKTQFSTTYKLFLLYAFVILNNKITRQELSMSRTRASDRIDIVIKFFIVIKSMVHN